MRVFYSLLLIAATALVAYSQDLTYVEFPKADSIAEQYPRHSLRDLQGLSKKLTGNLNTEEAKFRAIYKWVCLNIANDGKIAQANRRNREKLTGDELAAWNAKLIPQVNKKLMEQYVTICTGYAWLIQQLSKYAGLECQIVHGYGRTIQSNIGGKGFVNHSWNAIKLNGKWYLCDATWSSGALDLRSSSFIKKYEDAYFLSDPQYFIRNHYPLDSKWTLLDEYPMLDEFLNGPLIYVAAYSFGLQPVSPGSFAIDVPKRSTITFQFVRNSLVPANNARLVIGSLETRDPTQMSNDILSISHAFHKAGIFPVHLTVDGKPVYSFRVTVK